MKNWPSINVLCFACIGTALTVVLGFAKRGKFAEQYDREDSSSIFSRAAKYFAVNCRYFTADVQLELYALYKQATRGDAPDDVGFGVMGDAWRSKRGISEVAAESAYVLCWMSTALNGENMIL